MKKILFLLLFVPFFIGCEKEPINDEVCWECEIIETLSFTRNYNDDLEYFLSLGYTIEDLTCVKEVKTICYTSEYIESIGYAYEDYGVILEDSYNFHSSTRAGIPVYFRNECFTFSRKTYIDRTAECTLITN